jgi:hypothetical protein
MTNRVTIGLLIAFAIVGRLANPVRADEPGPDSETIRTSILRSLPLLEKGARGSMTERKQCFTCHNQGLPILALSLAKSRGFAIDETHLDEQMTFIADFLSRNRGKYLDGSGTGGRADTAGYALWALSAGGWKNRPDSEDPTAAVAQYLLGYQADQGHWTAASHRPPTENSPFTTTFLAARGLKFFGTSEPSSRIDTRLAAARDWLRKTAPKETEDHVFRIRALALLGESNDDVLAARDTLLQMQRQDGGWAQLSELESDPYATATVLAAIHQSASVPTDHEAYQSGLRFLLKTQQADGSWHVVSRSKPFQTYFESGYPHGKDQFISIAAGSWATMALTLTLPEHASLQK